MGTAADFESMSRWASILHLDRNIDRRTCRRTKPLEVLSLGAPRTKTISMARAYEILGYANPYHFANILENSRDSDVWLEALEAKFDNPTGSRKQFGRAEFDKLLGHTGVVADAPCIVFWKELVEAYPEAKVVLVERRGQMASEHENFSNRRLKPCRTVCPSIHGSWKVYADHQSRYCLDQVLVQSFRVLGQWT